MKKFNLITLSLILLFGATTVFAISVDELKYPIEELGACASKEDCALFCSKDENKEICLDFAETNNLLPIERIKKARIMLKLGVSNGPGGCESQSECREYCSLEENLEECIGFARKYKLMKDDDLNMAEKVRKALALGQKKPGDCQGIKDCRDYCALEENLDECVDFAEATEMMTRDEISLIRKTKGKGPGDCRSKSECGDYCEQPENLEECISFGLDKGLMSFEDSKRAQKVMSAIKNGAKAPNCKRGECQKYCQEEENQEECIDFAQKAGIMNAGEIEKIRERLKAGLKKGPGNCRGDEECLEYCGKERNAEECLDYNLENGLISQEQYDRIKENRNRKIEDGPGDCTSKSECDAYCDIEENQEECAEYSYREKRITVQEYNRLRSAIKKRKTGGPGGCKTEEECTAYCSDPTHKTECQSRNPAGRGEDIAPPTSGSVRNYVTKDLKEGITRPINDNPEKLEDEIGDEIGDSMAEEAEAEAKAEVDCSQFSAVPDCSYVSGEGRELCESCK